MADKPLGKVTHFFDHLSVAVVKLEKGASLKKGDKVHFQGGERDFDQVIESLQVDHKDVEKVKAGDDFGIKVDQKVHEGDKVLAA
jgi:translation initiation factor IF-2